MFQIKIAAIVIGGILCFGGFREYRLSQGTTKDPVSLEIAAIQDGSADVSNAHIKIGKHLRVYPGCVFEYETSKYGDGEMTDSSKVNHAYYPIVADVPNPSLDGVKVLVKTREFKTVGAIPEESEAHDSVQGLLINKVSKLKDDEVDFLRQGFGEFDPDTALILEEGKAPASAAKKYGMMGGGALLAIIGLLSLIGVFGKKQ